jgi:protein TonB
VTKLKAPRPATAIALSLLAHVGMGHGLQLLPHFAVDIEPPPQSFEVEMPQEEPPPQPVKDELEPEPEPEKPEPPQAEPPPKVEAPEPEPALEEPQAAPEPSEPTATPPVPGFLTAAGSSDGLGLNAGQLGTLGALRAPAPRVIPAKPAPPPPPAPPRQVSFKDLRQKPRPPRLDDALERNYPPAARLQGSAGEARVLLTVSHQGKVTAVRVVSATNPDFAEACRRTLSGTTWSAPLDQEGRAVGTLIPYECRFRVAP